MIRCHDCKLQRPAGPVVEQKATHLFALNINIDRSRDHAERLCLCLKHVGFRLRSLVIDVESDREVTLFDVSVTLIP